MTSTLLGYETRRRIHRVDDREKNKILQSEGSFLEKLSQTFVNERRPNDIFHASHLGRLPGESFSFRFSVRVTRVADPT